MIEGLFRKGLILSIILLLISMNTIALTADIISLNSISPTVYNGKTLYVGGTGEGNYTKIQDAIDDASDGDAVFVYSGVYHESIHINKSISVYGEDKDATIIDGDDPPKMVQHVWITADNVEFKGFKVERGVEWDNRGICIFNCSNCLITNNRIENIGGGVRVECVDSALISDNSIKNTGYGIVMVEFTNNLTITGNTIVGRDPKGGAGIVFAAEFSMNYVYRDITIIGNTIMDHWFGIGHSLAPNPLLFTFPVIRDTIIIRNTIKNNNFPIVLVVASYTVIRENNFLMNMDEATFLNSFHTIWEQNYWDRPRTSPKLIFGRIGIFTIWIPWINIDWQPASEPYDIGS